MSTSSLKLVILQIIFAALLGFLLAWLNVREISLLYEISKLSKKYEEELSIHEKLVVEKSVLFSPYNLKLMAKSLDMHNLGPENIRKIE